MTSHMREVPVCDLPPDSVLAQAVCDAQGALLLPEGIVLSHAMIERLVQRGIERVAIRSAPGDESPETPTARRAQITARVERLFRAAGDGPGSQALRHALLRYRRGELP